MSIILDASTSTSSSTETSCSCASRPSGSVSVPLHTNGMPKLEPAGIQITTPDEERRPPSAEDSHHQRKSKRKRKRNCNCCHERRSRRHRQTPETMSHLHLTSTPVRNEPAPPLIPPTTSQQSEDSQNEDVSSILDQSQEYSQSEQAELDCKVFGEIYKYLSNISRVASGIDDLRALLFYAEKIYKNVEVLQQNTVIKE